MLALTVGSGETMQRKPKTYGPEEFKFRFPLLASLLAQGYVFIEQTGTGSAQYVGRSSVPSILAPEGLVSIGNVGDEIATESYLQKFPSPEQW